MAKKVISKDNYIEGSNIKLDILKMNVVYSTDEQIVGKWTNGKNLYRKTIYAIKPSTNAIANQNIGIIHNIANIDEAFCDFTHSYIEWSGRRFLFGNNQWQYDNGNSAYLFAVNFAANKSDVSFYLGAWNIQYAGNITICITIEYTKTTD